MRNKKEVTMQKALERQTQAKADGVAVRVLASPETRTRKPLWIVYQVRLSFVTKLCASVPANPELVKAWIEARKPKVRPPGSRSIEEIQEEVLAALADPGEEELSSLLVFQREGRALVVRAATFRAHLKDCARVLSAQWIGKIQGERAFSTRVINGVYPDPKQYWVPILRPDGEPVEEPDGVAEKAIHVRGPRGEPQNALKCYQWVKPARLDFKLLVLGHSVSGTDLEHLLRYGGVHGYGGERGDGEGKYMATIEKIGEED